MQNKNQAEKFLATFNELEKHFKSTLFQGQWKSFKQMLKEASRKDPIIKRYKEELFEFTDLRNAIVHNRNHNYEIIAEPHEYIVKRFAKISRTIINPAKVSIFNKPVFTCNINQPIKEVIALMDKEKISQVPVIDDQLNVVEILNATNIPYWLAANNYQIELNATVGELIKHKEYKNNFSLISQNTSVYHAAEAYKYSYKRAPENRYFDAILISEKGLPQEPLSGIIVLSDMAKYI